MEEPSLRDVTEVFAGRDDAGERLAEMLAGRLSAEALVLAIPAGGINVGAAIARRLGLELGVAVVSKATPSWNTEVGFGAVAWDGTEFINRALVHAMRLTPAQIQEGLERARAKVARRAKLFYASQDAGKMPALQEGREVILVDDGLATGVTMAVAVEALRKAHGRRIIAAVPTAHLESAEDMLARVDLLVCPNIRTGASFAVAQAYRHWYDVSEEEAVDIHQRTNEDVHKLH